jgi:hypothetical protein
MNSMPGTRKKLKAFYLSVLLINLLAVLLGILYLYLSERYESSLWNLYSLFIFTPLIGNICIAYIEDPRSPKGYVYLAFSAICLLMIPVFNSLASFSPTHYNSRSVVSCVLIFSLFFSGVLLTASRLFSRKTEAEILLDDLAIRKLKKTREKSTAKTVFIVFLSMILFAGAAAALKILIVSEKLWSFEVFLPAASVFYAFVSLSVGALILKLLTGNAGILVKIIY